MPKGRRRAKLMDRRRNLAKKFCRGAGKCWQMVANGGKCWQVLSGPAECAGPAVLRSMLQNLSKQSHTPCSPSGAANTLEADFRRSAAALKPEVEARTRACLNGLSLGNSMPESLETGNPYRYAALAGF